MEIVEELAAVAGRIAAIEALSRGARSNFAPSLGERANDSTTSRAEIKQLAVADGARYRIDPALIEAIVAAESGFDPKATSAAGARGLMQLMPKTAAALDVADAYDPAQNVAAGTRYLRGLWDRFGELDLAVAAYNAGPNAVLRYGGIPPYPETRRYVREVLDDYRRRLQAGNVATNEGSQHGGSIVP